MREIKPSTDDFDNVDNLTQLEWSWQAGKVYYWSGESNAAGRRYGSRWHRYCSAGRFGVAVLGLATYLPKEILRTLQMAACHIRYPVHGILLHPLQQASRLLGLPMGDHGNLCWLYIGSIRMDALP